MLFEIMLYVIVSTLLLVGLGELIRTKFKKTRTKRKFKSDIGLLEDTDITLSLKDSLRRSKKETQVLGFTRDELLKVIVDVRKNNRKNKTIVRKNKDK